MPLLFDGPEFADFTLILAHGAGAAMDSPFMNRVAGGMAAEGIRVGRFEFPYMQARRDGGRPPPDREAVLLRRWREVAAQFDPVRTCIGGKSMGGRMASMIADELGVRGLVCFGYPFHPPGRPEKLRTAHLRSLGTPALLLQGERDPFGGLTEVPSYELSPSIDVRWLPDGDHDLRPRRSSGHSHDENLREAVRRAVAFVRNPAGRPATE